jgi:hypothetical protein
MNLQHVNVKIFVDDNSSTDLEAVIPIFHRWIAEDVMDQLLIDVADYRHVPMGPGVLLVGLEVDYSMDNTANQLGLRFNCKSEREGSNEDRFAYSLRCAAKACQELESEMDGLKFDRSRLQFSINDRALAPNTEETHRATHSELSDILGQLLGDQQIEFEYSQDARSLFGAIVRLSKPMELADLAADAIQK